MCLLLTSCGAPGLSWDAMPKIGGSGVLHISKRYSKAKKNYLKSYDPKRESKHNIFLDKNNLYGYVMS